MIKNDMKNMELGKAICRLYADRWPFYMENTLSV